VTVPVATLTTHPEDALASAAANATSRGE